MNSKWSNRIVKAVVVLAVATVIGGTASSFAQGGGWGGGGGNCPRGDGNGPGMGMGRGGGPGMGMGRGGGPGMGGGFHGGWMNGQNSEQGLAQTKARLGLTATQEKVWNDYAQAVTDATRARQEQRATSPRMTGVPFTDPQAVEQHREGMARVFEKKQGALTAYEELLKVLTPGQKSQLGTGCRNCPL